MTSDKMRTDVVVKLIEKLRDPSLREPLETLRDVMRAAADRLEVVERQLAEVRAQHSGELQRANSLYEQAVAAETRAALSISGDSEGCNEGL